MDTVKYKVEKTPKRKPNGDVPLWYCSWLAVNEQNKLLRKAAATYATGRLIDIGCGTKPLKNMFAPYVEEHVGLDHNEMFHQKDNVDIFADAYSIPVPDGSFDTVLCTDVLEHLEEPQKAVDEMYRVLSSANMSKNGNGGCAILSTPFVWHLHEQPRDFYRYTKFGLRHLAEKAGFKVVSIQPTGGFCLTVAHEIAYMIYYGTKLKILRPFQILLMNVFLVLGKLLNYIDPTKDRLPHDYVFVFRKE